MQPTRWSLEATSLLREYPMFPRGLFGGPFLKAQCAALLIPRNCEERKPRRSIVVRSSWNLPPLHRWCPGGDASLDHVRLQFLVHALEEQNVRHAIRGGNSVGVY